MALIRRIALAAGLVALLAGNVLADEAQGDPKLVTPQGMVVTVGGGVIGFADSATRDFASVGGIWDARLAIGTHGIIAVEAGYTGGAQAIDALGLDTSAVLLSTGLEGAVRLNFTNGELQPYMIAGAGWRRYDLTNATTNTSSVAETDNVFEVPVGVGMSYRVGSMIFDARGVFRSAFDADLIGTAVAGEQQKTLDTIEAQLQLGWEF